jgi:hypothetical protein
MPYRKVSVALEIVMHWHMVLDEKGHYVSMNNYFSLVGLLTKMASKGIYAIGIVTCNCIALPSSLKNKKTFKRCEQRFMDWAMHENRGHELYSKKNKYLVLFLSTHAKPTGFPCLLNDIVSCRNEAIK